MKRALFVGAGTLAGLAAVLGLNPDNALDPAAAVSGTDGSTATTDSGSTATDSSGSTSSTDSAAGGTSGGSASAAGGGSAQSGTYSGEAIQVRNFGTMQVQVTVSDGSITDVTALQVPDWDNKSRMINSYAVPQLTASALKSQSADVSYVSGATFTSMAFTQSLQSALAKAGLG